MLQVEMRGASLSEGDLAALESYVLSLAPFDRGRVDATGAPIEPATLRARRGFEVFLRARCSLCHLPPAFARSMSADVGTGGKFNVPTLRGLSSTAPYGHDGRFASIEEAVRAIVAARKTELGEIELEYLLEYLSLL
jgi:cytochrome c peroxidase